MSKNNYYKKSSNKRSKGGYNKHNNKEMYPEQAQRENAVKERAGNDVEWYIPNGTLLKDVASYPFSYRLGNPFQYNPGQDGQFDMETYNTTIGGICSIDLQPTVGMATDDAYSPLNLAMRAIYAFVRHANSGSKNYDAPDLMMYLLTMDSIYMYWSWMVRLYGTLRLYSYKNSFYPGRVAQAMGIELESDVLNNIQPMMAQLRAYINNFAVRASSYAVPTDMPLFKRHMWLFQNIFADREDEKAQLYIFKPAVVYRYNDTTASLVPELVKDFTTLDDIMNLGNLLLNSIVRSEDIGIMSGDILKAYGESNLFKLAMIEDNFHVMPIYNENILSQIHNLTILPLAAQNASIIQSMDTGNIYQQFQSVIPNYSSELRIKNNLINIGWKDPTPEDVMIATRLTASIDGSDEVVCGSEVVTGIRIYTNTPGDSNFVQAPESNWISYDSTQNTVPARYLTFFALASNFQWFPKFIITVDNNNAAPIGGDGYLMCDLSNYTVIDKEPLRNLHIVALSGEFGIPDSLTKM